MVIVRQLYTCISYCHAVALEIELVQQPLIESAPEVVCAPILDLDTERYPAFDLKQPFSFDLEIDRALAHDHLGPVSFVLEHDHVLACCICV